MLNNYDFLYYQLLGNSVRDYIVAVLIFIILYGVFQLVQSLIMGRLNKLAKKTSTRIDDILIEIVQSIRPSFYSFLAFYIAVLFLNISSLAQNIIDAIIIIWVIYQVVVVLQILINLLFQRLEEREGEDDNVVGSKKMAIQLLGKITKGILWMVAVLMVLSNLGVNITSLIAGLGIGGVAVALALQNVLGDLFSAFVIYFDKPFVVGDFIIVGDSMGTVEKIGIKTTRLRALQGEEIIMSNTDLVSGEIHNFKRMRDRRIVFEVGVEYDTPQEILERIPKMIEKSVDPVEDVDFSRAHLKEFGDSSLVFEVVYNVLAADFDVYMSRNQEILFNIRKEFQKEDIGFAFPTRTVHLEKSEQ